MHAPADDVLDALHHGRVGEDGADGEGDAQGEQHGDDEDAARRGDGDSGGREGVRLGGLGVEGVIVMVMVMVMVSVEFSLVMPQKGLLFGGCAV